MVIVSCFRRNFSYILSSLSGKMGDVSIATCKSIIPKLSPTQHKGSNGRIGVIGGSLEYTGAPYFAAMSALTVGADLLHVFCSKAAAPVIKTYSPELIVHPLMDTEKPLEDIAPWLERLHSLVVGPGLGRDAGVIETVKSVIDVWKKRRNPLVIDADGLYILAENLDLLKGCKGPVILTPNKIEFQRLVTALGTPNSTALELAKKLKCVVLLKGEVDIIANGCTESGGVAECREAGSWRRCGGQGDVLSGSVAIFAAWQSLKPPIPGNLGFGVACYAAATLTRRCSNLAFSKHRRSMIATNLIECIQESFESLFEDPK